MKSYNSQVERVSQEFINVYGMGYEDHNSIQIMHSQYPFYDHLTRIMYLPVDHVVIPHGHHTGINVLIPLCFSKSNIVSANNFELGNKSCFKRFIDSKVVSCNDANMIVNDNFSAIKFFRGARHFQAGVAWAALRYCIDDVSEFVTKQRNILDVGNAGETWFFNIFKRPIHDDDGIYFVDGVSDLNYYTLDIANSQKHSDNPVSKTVPHDRWFEIIHDASKIETIDESLLPDKGFDIIHVARGSCELFKNTDYIKTLKDLYDLLSPGGTLVFPAVVVFVNNDEEMTQVPVVYNPELGEFKIGSDVPVLLFDDDFHQIAKNTGITDDVLDIFLGWQSSNNTYFYRKNILDSEASVKEYAYKFVDSHTRLSLRELPFFDLIRVRSSDVTVVDVFCDQSQCPALTCRTTFTVTKPKKDI